MARQSHTQMSTQEERAHIHEAARTWTFTAALPTTAETCRPPMGPSPDDQTHKTRPIHPREQYSAIRRDPTLTELSNPQVRMFPSSQKNPHSH